MKSWKSTTLPGIDTERTLTVSESLIEDHAVHLCLDDPTRPNRTLVITVPITELLEAIRNLERAS